MVNALQFYLSALGFINPPAVLTQKQLRNTNVKK